MTDLERRIEELERWRAIVERYLDFDPIKTSEIEERALQLPVRYTTLQ